MAASFSITGNTEILQIADAVAREKGIEKENVIKALEDAIQVAGRRKYGHEQNIKAEIDAKSGEIKLFRLLDVVETVENPVLQISLKDAKFKKADAEVGEIISEQLPPIEFGRVTAQTAKQVIVQKVRDAERDKQFDDFKDRADQIVSGIVKRVEYGNVVVDLMNRAEAIIRRDEVIPRESFKQGDRIRAYVYDVRREKKGPQIFLSRTHPEFLAKLFAQEVPEIYDGIILIKAVARDPGSRAKIAVYSNESGIDPVGSCVGVRGARVQAVVNELQGEKIDIIQWSPDPATFVVAALAPAEVTKIVIDEENERIEVVVPDEQLSLAIGRRGQNVKLASQLVGWNIEVLTEEEESKRRTEEFQNLSKLFVEALNVEDVIAHLLAIEGFKSIDDVAYIPVEDLASIEGFSPEVAEELNQRAKDYLQKQAEVLEQKWKELGVSDKLLEIPGMTADIMVKLGENNIKTGTDFADLARDDFIEIIPDSGKKNTEIDAMIMAARDKFYN